MTLASAVAGTTRNEEPRFYTPVTIAFPNPYTVGGEPFDPEDYMPSGGVLEFAMGYLNNTYRFEYNTEAQTIQVFVVATGVEAGAIDLSLQTGIVIGLVSH
jgi:hypothetical protein